MFLSALYSTEQRLKERNLLSYDGTGENKVYFKNFVIQGRIEDDHVPFLERGWKHLEHYNVIK